MEKLKKKQFRILKSAYKEAHRRGLIKENFFDSDDPIEKPKSHKQEKKVVALTAKEQYLLEKYINENYSKYNNIILLCLYTGMRIIDTYGDIYDYFRQKEMEKYDEYMAEMHNSFKKADEKQS